MLGLLVFVLAVTGHFAFALHWPKTWRFFEVAALLGAPPYFCISVLELLRYQRTWQVVVGVILSGAACVLLYFTLSGYLRGVYAA